MPSTRLTNVLFIWDLTFCSERGTWSNHVLEILWELNMMECFYEIQVCDLESAHQLLKEKEIASWGSEDIQNRSLGTIICTNLSTPKRII